MQCLMIFVSPFVAVWCTKVRGHCAFHGVLPNQLDVKHLLISCHDPNRISEAQFLRCQTTGNLGAVVRRLAMVIGNFTVSSTAKPELLCEDDLSVAASCMPMPPRPVSDDEERHDAEHAAFKLKAKRLKKQKCQREFLQDFLDRNRFSHVNKPRNDYLCRFSEQMYPIHLAAKHGDIRVLRLLLSAGASRQTKTSRGRIALDIAADEDRFGSHKEVLNLLRSGLKVMSIHEFVEMVETQRLQDWVGLRMMQNKSTLNSNHQIISKLGDSACSLLVCQGFQSGLHWISNDRLAQLITKVLQETCLKWLVTYAMAVQIQSFVFHSRFSGPKSKLF